MALVFAQLGERRLRAGLAALIDRRLVAPDALRRYLARGPKSLTAQSACRAAADRFADLFNGVRGGLTALLEDGPIRQPQYSMLATDIRRLVEQPGIWSDSREGQAALRAVIDRLRAYS